MSEGDSCFEQISSVFCDGEVPVKKYRSKASGLTVCIAEAEGPLVAGYLCLATETHDDDGLPHTLEHLIFLGSESYPYKGVLDLLSNRCLASGTNAWTDTDHTCYTMTTAGQEGFLKLLPIYVDHILYPILSDAAFDTEVHHVNGEGENAGVVYCEMQDIENNGENKCHWHMLEAIYPGHCGYKSETGGRLKNLRENTNNEKVKAYHKSFYRPENLSIIIVGQINATDVFAALQPIEKKILNKDKRPPFVRPWQTAVPPFEKSTSINVQYRGDEDEFGLILAAWRGPEAKNYHDIIAIQTLMEYLLDTSISPLQREFVEIPDPMCSSVDYTLIENSVTCIQLHFSSVPVKKLDQTKSRLLSVLSDIADGTEAIDMNRMATVIHKKELYILSQMESRPHKHIALNLIGDFLYGTTNKDMENRLKQVPLIRDLLKKNEEFWRSLLKQYIVDGNHVFVLGSGSPSLASKEAEEEKARIEEQQKKLGSEGLKMKADQLKKSIEYNEVPAPPEVFQAVSLPSVESIKLHSVQRFNNYTEGLVSPEAFKLTNLPARFQLDFVQTNFIRMYTILDAGNIPQHLSLYLPLLLELIVESPLMRNGELIPYQEVVKELAADTVSTSTSLGFGYTRFYCTEFPQLFVFSLVLEEDKYLKGIQWTREILFQTVFEPSRIKVIANKMLTDISSKRRDGHFLTKVMMSNLCFSAKSNHWVMSMMRQYKFLTKVCEKVSSSPDEVVSSLNKLRALLTDVNRITVHLALNQASLKAKEISEKPWIENFLPKSLSPNVKNCQVQGCSEMIRDFSIQSKPGAAVGLSAVESSFVLITAPCLKSYTHEDYPALLILIQYLTQLEGPLWRQIRGMGLAYAANIYLRPSEGLIYFVLYRSTSPVKAYHETLKIIDSYLKKDVSWDMSLFESALGSLVFDLVECVKTVESVVTQSMTAYYKGVGTDYLRQLLQSISKVKIEDMERVGSLYLKPLFDSTLSKCTLCCHSAKVTEVVSGFKQSFRELTILNTLEDNLLTDY